MSVRNIDKEYIKTDIVLGTSITVPISFSGPYTVHEKSIFTPTFFTIFI